MTAYVWLVKNKSLAGASRAIPSMQYYSILLSYVNYGIGVKQADMKKKKKRCKEMRSSSPLNFCPTSGCGAKRA